MASLHGLVSRLGAGARDPALTAITVISLGINKDS